MSACILQWLLRRIPGVAAMLDSMPTQEDLDRLIAEAFPDDAEEA